MVWFLCEGQVVELISRQAIVRNELCCGREGRWNLEVSDVEGEKQSDSRRGPRVNATLRMSRRRNGGIKTSGLLQKVVRKVCVCVLCVSSFSFYAGHQNRAWVVLWTSPLPSDSLHPPGQNGAITSHCSVSHAGEGSSSPPHPLDSCPHRVLLTTHVRAHKSKNRRVVQFLWTSTLRIQASHRMGVLLTCNLQKSGSIFQCNTTRSPKVPPRFRARFNHAAHPPPPLLSHHPIG
jgi:hypothetical protein